MIFPDTNLRDVTDIVARLRVTKAGDVINDLAIARNADGTFYVEGVKRALGLWDAADTIARAYRCR